MSVEGVFRRSRGGCQMVNEEKRESWKFVFMEVADVVLDPIKFVAIK